MVRVQIGSEFPVIDESMRNVDMVSTQDGIGAPRGLTVAFSKGGTIKYYTYLMGFPSVPWDLAEPKTVKNNCLLVATWFHGKDQFHGVPDWGFPCMETEWM